MTDQVDTVDIAVVLEQFLSECELPTPTSTAPLDLELSHEFHVHEDTSTALEGPRSNGGGLELNEPEKQALLQVIDKYDAFPTVPPSVKPSPVTFERPQRGQLVGKAQVGPPTEEMLKLAMKRAKATKRRNRHRARVKMEWQSLRLQSTLLSARLEALKRSRDNDVSALKWQAVASKEMHARQQAERQQHNIRLAIEHRARELQNLLDAWHHHTAGNEMQPEWTFADKEMLKNFLVELDVSYTRTDTVLHDSGLARAVPPVATYFTPARKWDAISEFEFFESTSAMVMPSKYAETANAMFDCMRQVHRQNRRRKLYEAVEDPSNTIAVKFGVVYHYEAGMVFPLSLVFVQRRYVEPNRTVLVWRGVIENNVHFGGVCLNTTGWCVLRPAGDKGSGSEAFTDVRTCEYLVPVRLSADHDQGCTSDIQQFAEVSIRSAQPDMLQLAHLMEKMLLEN